MAKNDLIAEAFTRWQEAREVSLILHETWAAVIRSRRLIIESAIKAGLKPAAAAQVYQDTLKESQAQYIQAFTRACELSDEHTALVLGVPVPKKKKR